MDRKFFFFDIDGTLMVHDGLRHYVPESAVRTLKELREAGHMVAIATGRSYCMSREMLERFDVSDMVCSGGNGVVVDGKLIEQLPLEHETAVKIIRECMELGLSWSILKEDGMVRISPDARFHDSGADVYSMKTEVIPGLVPEDCPEIFKIFVLCPRGEEGQLKSLEDVPYFRYGKEPFFLVEPCDKSKGIRRLIALKGGKNEDAVVFGDGHNDVTMFCPGWTRIAMGNAVPELKELADYITDEDRNNGIRKACLHFGWVKD